MKKINSILLYIVTIVLLSSQVCSADFFRHRYGLGLKMSRLDDINDTDKGVTFDFDSDIAFEGNLTYFFSDYYSLEFGVGSSGLNVKATPSGGSEFDFGEINQMPILLTLRRHFRTNGMASPYIGIGVGHYFNEFELSNIGRQQLGAATAASFENGYGIHVAGGLEYFISNNVALNLDAKYVWNRTDLNVTIPGQQEVKYDIDLEKLFLGIGFKYYFSNR